MNEATARVKAISNVYNQFTRDLEDYLNPTHAKLPEFIINNMSFLARKANSVGLAIDKQLLPFVAPIKAKINQVFDQMITNGRKSKVDQEQ